MVELLPTFRGFQLSRRFEAAENTIQNEDMKHKADPILGYQEHQTIQRIQNHSDDETPRLFFASEQTKKHKYSSGEEVQNAGDDQARRPYSSSNGIDHLGNSQTRNEPELTARKGGDRVDERQSGDPVKPGRA